MINLLTSPAFAQATETTQSQFSPASFVPLILIFTIFYFLIIRPQTKKMKEHENIIKNLKVGEKVITNSGIIGFIRKIHDKENQIELEIAENVIITILRSHINEVEKPHLPDKKASIDKKSNKKSAKN
jgi:preprotein translocase subunit YajC